MSGWARGFAGLVALTSALIVLGALVRAHDAGLACPDWPQCFGTWIPRFNLQIAFEWTHRLIAGSVAILFVLLAWGTGRTLRDAPWRGRVFLLLGLATGLLAVQILLGALTVWLQLASWTVTAHLVTGNAFNATLCATALALRDGSRPPTREPLPPRLRFAIGILAALLILQLVLGGQVSSRYAGLACPEWPTCNGGSFFPSWRGPVGLHLAHRTVGYALLVAGAALTCWGRAQASLRGPLALLVGLLAAQVVIGIANVRLAIPVEITGLHSALAAALVLTTTVLVHRASNHSWGWG